MIPSGRAVSPPCHERGIMVSVTRSRPEESPQKSLGAALVLLVLRGVLLWIVVPIGILAWLFLAVILRRRGVTIGQFLGWLDLNLVAAIEGTVLRPWVRSPLSWTPRDQLPSVTHRVGAMDAA
jgi:hypothetical protein